MASTSPLFKNFIDDVTTLRENCVGQLQFVEKNSPNFEKNLEAVYNKCTDGLLEQVKSITETVASALALSIDEVGSAVLSEGFVEPLSCISSKLLKVYPLLVSTVDVLNAKVNELLGT
jgi:hypothetical protein